MSDKQQTPNAFDHVPANAGGHFVLCIYAAIYRLLYQVFRLSQAGGMDLEALFQRYPFLADYFTEMRAYMPDSISWEQGAVWWQSQVESWEAAHQDAVLPLRFLATEAGLTWSSRMVFMLVGLVEEDSRFGTLFAQLQEPLPHRRPTLELVGQMMMNEAVVGETDPWSICQPLLEIGALEAPDKSVARSEWMLRAPPLLWDAARGRVTEQLAGLGRRREAESLPDLEELLLETGQRGKLQRLPHLIRSGMVRLVIVRAIQGADSEDVLGAVGKAMGRGVISIDLEQLETPLSAVLGPLCVMTRSMPVFRCDLGPGETVGLPKLPGYSGPVGVTMGDEGGLRDESTDKALTFHLQSPDIALRRQRWRREFGDHPVEDLDAIAENFRLPGDYIRAAAEMAVAHAQLNNHSSIALEDVREAGQALNRQLLDSLASHLEAAGRWEDLIVGDGTLLRLHELFRRCRNREKLAKHLGPGFGHSRNCGVRALLTGGSGTGKTLAAKIVAAELGMDLYRVDLAAIVNKYIGETEKNLHRILSRAEALDVVLLLDEGDALLGNRTEVKSANDRYANLETNYLLQRLENYQGIVLITTNLAQNIDRAFQRRMDVLVPFFSPQADERLRILQRHLPADHAVEPRWLEMAAAQCTLNGGQLRNVVLNATLNAVDQDCVLDWCHLEDGLRSEYRKAGGTFPLDGLLDRRQRDVDLQRFAGALDTG